MIKICNNCNQEKSQDNFANKNKCISCFNLKRKEYTKKQNASNNSKLRKIAWVLKNQEYLKRKRKDYYIKNKDKIKLLYKTPKYKETKRLYKIKRRENFVFRLRENISNSIYKALTKGKSNKAGQSIFKFLNYNIEDLKKHIENQFDETMSWKNYGTLWHLDHIVPHSDFNYISMDDDLFKDCWRLENLRPLNAIQNLIDGATRIRHKARVN